MQTLSMYVNGELSINNKITGYAVRQLRAGTVVYRCANNGLPPLKDLGETITLPKNRYVLSDASQADEFERDFLAAWNA